MQKFINNWAGTLLAPADAADEVLLVDTTGLPELGEGEYLLLTLAGLRLGRETAWEIVRVTGVAEGELTVERAQEGTAALEWDAATPLSARLTAGSLEALTQDTGWILTDPSEDVTGAYEIYVRRRNGVVFLRALLLLAEADAYNAWLTTLPEGFRPAPWHYVLGVSGAGATYVAKIEDNGELRIEFQGDAEPLNYITLDAISFPAA